MDRLRFAAGTILLLIPFVFAVFLPGLILVIIPSLSMIAGTVLILDGIGAFSLREQARLNKLELTILKMLSEGSKVDAISVATGVSEVVVNEKIRRLQELGYLIGEKLTEKGYELAKGKKF